MYHIESPSNALQIVGNSITTFLFFNWSSCKYLNCAIEEHFYFGIAVGMFNPGGILTKGCYRLEKGYNKLPLTVATENKVTSTGKSSKETSSFNRQFSSPVFLTDVAVGSHD